jgi:hypothetical protein
MTITIQLDSKAVEFLIENMSEEMKIELKEELLHQAIKKILPFDYKVGVEKLLEKVIAKAEHQLIHRDQIGDIVLSEKGQKLLQPIVDKYIEKSFTEHLNTEVRNPLSERYETDMEKITAEIERHVKSVKATIDQKIGMAMNRGISEYIDSEVQRRISVVTNKPLTTLNEGE